MKRKHIFLQIWVSRISILLITLIPISSHADSSETVFFYNPESSIDNFAALKTEFDDYLSTQGGFNFQPFTERNIFENVLSNNPNGVYLLSSWHYQQISNKTKLEAKLIGQLKGEFQQRKILISKDISSISELTGATIAGAGSEEYLRHQLQQMLGNAYSEIGSKIKLLSVPKDIDALMAVGFGVATAAISSENSLNKLAVINQKQHSQLKTLAKSEKNFLLIAAVIAKPDLESSEPLLKAIETMPQQATGQKRLKMLGLDGWKRIDSLDPSLSKQLRLP